MARSSAVDGAFGASPQPQRDALTELDDSGLVAAFLAGEKRAFNLLVDRYQSRLLNFVYRTTGDRERAEDLREGTTAYDHDEFIELARMPLSRALAAIHRGEITDGKTVCAILFAHAFLLRG